MNNIGIIGKGFVGSAVESGFSNHESFNYEIKIFDKQKELSTHTLEQTVNESDILFVSVPTPSNSDGSLNIDILTECLSDISKIKKNDNIILLRSTITPGTSRMLSKKFTNLKIVFNPEFLTEKNAKYDFVNQARIVLGGEKKLTNKVKLFYQKRFGNDIKVIQTDYETAEMIKYMNNCFLATKVSFLNEMKILADKSNVDWKTAITGFKLDQRVGSSHNDVPGHDQRLGFGGSCFPKDVQALIFFAKSLNIDLNVLRGAWETNLMVRPEKDWENLKGRAVVD